MSWARFGYLCRKMAATCSRDGSIQECINNTNYESCANFYSMQLGKQTLPYLLLNNATEIKNKESSLAALKIYGGLQLYERLTEPFKIQKAVLYFALVLLVFYFVTATYRHIVLPNIEQMLASFSIEIPPNITAIQDHWWLLSNAVTVLLAAAIILIFWLQNHV